MSAQGQRRYGDVIRYQSLRYAGTNADARNTMRYGLQVVDDGMILWWS